MKKLKLISLIIIFIFLSSMSTINAVSVKENAVCVSVFYVGGVGPFNYTCVQEAINAASNCDTVFVYNGYYNENIIINKSIILTGENKTNTIIDGRGKTDTVTINSENTVIQGFTIINATGAEIIDHIFRAGIRVTASNNIIRGNIIKNNNAGVFARRVTNITIKDNSFYNNSITLSPYDVEETNIPLSEEYFIHNIENNTINDKKIVYLKNQKNIKIPEETGQLITYNCSNITIQNLNCSKCDFALLMTYTDHCTIKNSKFIDDADIWLMQCTYNLFEYNNMMKNFHGITLDYQSKHNILRYNNFSENHLMGVMIETRSDSNLIEKNNLMKNNQSNAFMRNSFRNKWKNNYWDTWAGLKHPCLRFMPATIFGWPFKKINITAQVNFDWHPQLEPYEI